ncbi:MAG TPA: polysaccharide biosynthesis C-terminal domain-containing protein, partial [Trueperaceae bacterium]|nr:polysaccharide biosynthesis C-terminal domain-containing protein [Trueperaceae bacterium]
GLAVFPLGVFNLLIRTFYIRSRVRVPVLVVLGSLLLQAGLYLVLAPRLGIAGVSWAVVVGAFVQFSAAALLVERAEGFGLRKFITYALSVWVAAIAAVAVAAGILALVPGGQGWYSQLARLALGGVSVVVTYALACSVLRLPEMTDLRRRFRR